MKKIVLLIFLLINLSGFAQSYYCTKNITLTDCKVNFINNVPSKWAQLDATLMTWSVDQVGSYIIKDGVTQVTIKNDGCLVSPTFANLDDSLIAWQSRCLSSGGATIPIPLLVDNIGIDTVRVLDSVRVWFSQGLDTSNQGILNGIFGILRDSLDKQLYVLNPYIDSAIVRRMDTIIDRLTTTEKLDTLKGLVYTAIAKVRTNRDTLFNCKSLSFGRKSGASGTLVLTYENGESESYDVANDDLPTWVNGEFISYIDYNATGAVGLIVNTLGCSQTSTEICAKVKPIFDCELVVPITCNGWQSASGVWQTISGCWNTGQ